MAAPNTARERPKLMHFVFLVPISGAVLWFLFFVLLADAAPAFVGAVALTTLLAFIAWVITQLQLWGSVGAFFALILGVVAIGFALSALGRGLNWLSIFRSRIQGYPSKEAKTAATALADLKRAEARADSSALKARAAHEHAVQYKSFFARYRANSAEQSALYEEQVVLGKKKVWEQAEAEAVRKAEDATQMVRTKAFAEAARQKQADLARETVMARAERAKGKLRAGNASAQVRTEPPVTRKLD